MTLHKGNKILIVGNYRFTGKLLGKGNFARVEEAIHTLLNVKVAIKIMDLKNIKEVYVLKNLYREAKLLSKLNHPCIISLYQTMQRSEHVYYLVSELAAGGDLCTYVKKQKHGKLEEKPTRRFARQFVSAISHMHNLGIVHRDLKMENVMLNLNQTMIKIVDFGLSNLYSSDRLLRTHCGSPEYAAPELFITGRKYGPEVDIWSLGIILYGMVVGQLPFTGNRSQNVSSQERRKELISQINKGLNACHKKILADLSQDFQNMLNEMLTAAHDKRIKTSNLLCHPWITENGKKCIKLNPMKKIDEKVEIKFVTELCNILKEPLDNILNSITNEPLNSIGGMYNILTHEYALARLNGDGITKILPSPPAVINNDNKCEKLLRNYPITRQPSSHNLHPIHSAIGHRFVRSKDNLKSAEYNYEISERDSTGSRKTRPIRGENKLRPQTVQIGSVKQQDYVDYKTIKSPHLRRKAYSAFLNSNLKIYRPATVSHVPKSTDGKKKPLKKLRSTILNNNGKVSGVATPNNDRPIPLPSSSSFRPKSPPPTDFKLKGKFQEPGNRTRHPVITPRNRKLITRTTSEKTSIDKSLQRPRPVTCVSQRLFQNVSKPGNVPCKVIMNRNSERTIVKSAQKISPKSAQTRQQQQQQQHYFTTGGKKTSLEKSPLVFGDLMSGSVNKNTLNKCDGHDQKSKKPIIYDPIARSIAGYVVNNIPNTFPF